MDIRVKWFYRLGFLLLLFIVIYIFVKLTPLWLPIVNIIFTVSLPFLIAGFISYLLHPVVEILHEKGMNRGLSIAIIYLLFFGGVGFGIYKGIPAMIIQVRELSESVPDVAEQYRHWVTAFENKTSHWPFGVHERLEDGITMIESRLEQLMKIVMAYLMRIFDFILLIALIPFIAFYILKDFDSIKKMVWYLTPKKWRSQGIAFLGDIDASLGGYIRGQILVCATVGTISALLFWIAGMDYPLLLGAIIGVTNVIPYFGPIIGAIPAVIIASSISVKMIIITAAIVFFLQFLEGNILSPLIVGKSLHMHPLFIILALLTGGEIGGLVGLILAVPILAVIKVCILHARNHFTKKKEAVL
ncbi:AI-2E family transporter [Peribacillus cavernae]|uniref:AI-2E family transporter n=1 Tax=Peribacillus cavernae TaxID=1674310 RepID=A0A433HWI8_9BACI|nr:AI-2E family transporter [Peribacillus cavernae]MDQ0218201.1 putative PurR-regulated permease PerM [Peribacillus cavernae]RUQ32657.1 AI-2E family transporter [Peribacillus cavernae]